MSNCPRGESATVYSRQICIFEHVDVDLDVHMHMDVDVDGSCLITRQNKFTVLLPPTLLDGFALAAQRTD
jgi:hypothetical protein